jgi:hypothetical protein
VAHASRPRLAAAARAAFFGAALLSGCGRKPVPAAPGPEIHVSADAALGRPSRLDATTEPGAEVTFTAGMTHPGMVPIVAKAVEGPAGVYVATMTWTMAGDWVVFLEARWPDGRRKDSKVSVRVAR